jgi:invasion protein IalB
MRKKLIASVLLSLAWHPAAKAQAPAAPVVPGEPAPLAPRRQAFGDWTLICATAPGASEESCEADVSLQPGDQLPPVAKVAFVRGTTTDKPLRLVAIVQANLTLEPGVVIAFDPGISGVILRFRSCLNTACLADAELSPDQAQSFRSLTQNGQMTIKNAAGETLSLEVPSRGLDQALDALLTAKGKG